MQAILFDYMFECSEISQTRFAKSLELLLAYLFIKELKALSACLEVKRTCL